MSGDPSATSPEPAGETLDGSAGASALPGLRVAALLVDAWFVLGSATLVGALTARAASRGAVSSAPDSFTALLFWLGLVAVAYPVLEGRWAGSPGKRLFGLRVVDSPGGRARSSAVSLRFAVFAPLALAYPIAVVAEVRGVLAGTPLTPELIGLLGWLSLGATVVLRNGGLGLHEWLSGTRVVASVEPEVTGVSRRRRVAALLLQVAIPSTLATLAGLLVLAEPPTAPAGSTPLGSWLAEAAASRITRVAMPLMGLAVLSAVAFGGGLALSLVGVRVETPGGRVFRLALRAVVAWTPLLASAALRQSHPAVAGALLLVWTAGLATAIVRPDRGLQDRLVGTRLVLAPPTRQPTGALRPRWLAAVVLVALGVLATAVVPGWQLRLRSEVDFWLAPLVTPALEVSEETTWLVEPLLPDGMPDYAAELNRLHVIGLEDNAAIPLARVFPHLLRVELLSRHGFGSEVSSLALGSSEPPYVRWEVWPWLPDDHPELAAWLVEHEAQLDDVRASVAAAANRVGFWVPEPEGRLYGTDRGPAVLPLLTAARGLCFRVLLRVHERRWSPASADLIAAHRLASVMCRGSDFFHRLLGASFLMLAAEASFPAIPRLPAADAEALFIATRDLPAPPHFLAGLELEVRFSDLARVDVLSASMPKSEGRTRLRPSCAHTS